MGNIHLVEPGTDILKINTRRPPIKIQWYWFALIFLAALALFAFLSNARQSAQASQPTQDLHGDFTRTPTPLGAPTSTATPTASPTALLDGVKVPGLLGTVTTSACKPIVQTQAVEVTRVVPGQCQPQKIEITRLVEITQIVTQIITSTAQPTQTPWIVEITRIVEVTPTITPTPTVTPTPGTIDSPTQTPTKYIVPTPGGKKTQLPTPKN